MEAKKILSILPPKSSIPKARFFLEKKFRGGKAPLTKKVGGGGQMLPKAAMPRSGPVGGSGGIPTQKIWRSEVPSEHFSEQILLAL